MLTTTTRQAVNDLHVYDDASSAHHSGVYNADDSIILLNENTNDNNDDDDTSLSDLCRNNNNNNNHNNNMSGRIILQGGNMSSHSQISSEAEASLNRPTVRSLDLECNDGVILMGGDYYRDADDDALLFLNDGTSRPVRSVASGNTANLAGSGGLMLPLGMGSAWMAGGDGDNVAEVRGDLDYPE